MQQVVAIEKALFKILIAGDFESYSCFVFRYKSGVTVPDVKSRLNFAWSAENPNLGPASTNGYNGIVGWKGTSKKTVCNIFNLQALM